MRRDDFPPDYTPFSLTGSAAPDGDRGIENRLGPSMGCLALAALGALLLMGLL